MGKYPIQQNPYLFHWIINLSMLLYSQLIGRGIYWSQQKVSLMGDWSVSEMLCLKPLPQFSGSSNLSSSENTEE